MNKNIIITVFCLLSFSLCSAQQYRVLGYTGKDTVLVANVSVDKNGNLIIPQDLFEGALFVRPATAEYSDLQKHNQLLAKNVNDKKNLATTKRLVVDTLNFNLLYHSPFWKDVIQNWAGLYFATSSGPITFTEQFVPDAKKTILRLSLQNNEAALHLTDNLISMLSQYNLEDAAGKIAQYSVEIGLQAQFNTERMLTASRLTGKKAPEIVGLKPAATKPEYTLLLFYETGCHYCEQEERELKVNYNRLKEKKVRIVSISTDTDKEIFETTAATFPWADKLCDFQFINGDNFKNYGVMSTPTVYLIDHNGIVVGRYASVLETDLLK